MRTITVNGGGEIYIGKSIKKKAFTWWCTTPEKQFKFGTISAYSYDEARDIMNDHIKSIGGTYSLKEVDLDRDFATLGTVENRRQAYKLDPIVESLFRNW